MNPSPSSPPPAPASASFTAPFSAPFSIRPARDHALDALRTLAVIGMMASHTARLVPRDARPDWALFVLLIEPVIPSLFLLLVGLSLARSFASARAGRRTTPGAWYLRQVKRAGALWLVSAVFFALELGPRLPDMFLAGGILANIAYAILLVGGLLALGGMGEFGGSHVADPKASGAEDAGPRGFGRLVSPRAAPLRAALVGTVLLAGSAFYAWLDATGQRIHPLNIGNSPFLPLWLFALAGAAWGTLFFRPAHGAPPPRAGRGVSFRAHGVLIAGTIAGILAGAVAVALLARYGLDALFSKPFGRSDAGRLIPAPVFGGEPLHIGYYNLRPVLAATCLGLQLAALHLIGALGFLSPRGRPWGAWFFALGRHALTAYILHLALLAALVVITGDRQPLKTGGAGTLTWIGLILICQTVVLLRGRNNIVHFKH